MEGRFPRWLVAYALIGLVQSGMIPVVLPLAAAPGATAGFTYAAYAAAGVAAPFVGSWSDRHRAHRRTLVAGLCLAAAASLLHALPGSLVQHMVTAALIGLGVASASTVATMFIVEVEPEERWDGLIGLLQASMSGGQLVGLLLAGMLGLHHVGDALVLAALLLLLGIPVALRYAPHPVQVVPRPSLPPRPPRSGEAGAIGAQRQFHRPSRRAAAGLFANGLAPFLLSWLLSYTATNGLSVMITVVMVRFYGTSATLPALAYAIGVGLSVLLYRRVAGWERRVGAWRVLRTGLAVRLALMVVILALSEAGKGATVVLPVLFCFALTQFVWPLLSVASTTLSVTLSPAHRAESAGLLNACSSLGATIGGVVGGALLHRGFPLLCLVVFLTVGASIAISWRASAAASAAPA